MHFLPLSSSSSSTSPSSSASPPSFSVLALASPPSYSALALAFLPSLSVLPLAFPTIVFPLYPFAYLNSELNRRISPLRGSISFSRGSAGTKHLCPQTYNNPHRNINKDALRRAVPPSQTIPTPSVTRKNEKFVLCMAQFGLCMAQSCASSIFKIVRCGVEFLLLSPSFRISLLHSNRKKLY